MNFNDIVAWCYRHWREIFYLLSLIITVVIYLCKKRPSYNLLDAIKEDILEVLPSLINSVEIDGNGQRKLNAVVNMVKDYVQKKYKIDFPEKLLAFVVSSIEGILSTPQKKGDN